MKFLDSLHIQALSQGGCYGEGAWVASSPKTLESVNPAEASVIGRVQLATLKDYETILQKAQNFSQKWAMTPAPLRGTLVGRIGELLKVHKEALGSLVSLEMGKIKAEGLGEVQEMIDMAEFAVGLSRSFGGKNFPSERPFHRLYEQWHPLGIVGVVTAFNFPVAVWAWNAFIGAVCGNITLWKPSSKVPLCAIAVQNICNQAMQELDHHSVFSLFIPENRALSEHFIEDTQIPLVSFTGSTQVGQHIHEVVSKRLGRTLLEMSGNNAVIVDETADLSLAVRAILFGAVGTAGQRCTSTRRLYVHERHHERLLDELRHAFSQVAIGNPLEEGILMGPLIDEDARRAYLKVIARIKSLGGQIVFGGKSLQRSGFFVEPTLVRAEPNWDVVQEETFAPILYVMPYRSFDEAIHMQNNVRQGLSSALFSNDLRHVEQFLSSLGSDCGLANINTGTSGAEIGGAFGGEKETGGGREAGSDAWKAYMRRQTVAINWGGALPLAQGIDFKVA
ncbi:MAG: aldehyde dehydrogenase family protein [Gammaproteobacteria bacterium]|nr:aldehyde dehydrogenase family protein [Gammaproteobacteria bacterium]